MARPPPYAKAAEKPRDAGFNSFERNATSGGGGVRRLPIILSAMFRTFQGHLLSAGPTQCEYQLARHGPRLTSPQSPRRGRAQPLHVLPNRQRYCPALLRLPRKSVLRCVENQTVMLAASAALLTQLEGAMHDFVHNENIARYRKLLAIVEGDPSRDEARYQMLLRLLADEVAEDAQPSIGRLPAA
jgi:hypothetical protein